MGLECGTYDDSNQNDVENDDVIYESPYKLSKIRESFENFIASSKFNININFHSSKFSKVEKKWLKCILYNVYDKKTIKTSINKQMIYCDSAIKETLLKLNNYESVLVFTYIFYNHRRDIEFIRAAYVLCIRWYFCLKNNFLLSETPYLGCIEIFNDLIWGLKSVKVAYTRVLTLLVGAHESSNDYIDPMLSYTSQDGGEDKVECSADSLIDVCTVFSKFQPSFEVIEFCKQFVSYVHDITSSLSKDRMILKYDGCVDVLDSLWNRLMTFSAKHNCNCRLRSYFLILDAYTDMVFNGELPYNVKRRSVNKLVGLYAKWLLIMTSSTHIENSIIKMSYEKFEEDYEKDEVFECCNKGILQDIQEMVDEIEYPYLNQKNEDVYQCSISQDVRRFIDSCVKYVPNSFSRFIKECVKLYKTHESVPKQILILLFGYVNYESDKSYEICKDLGIIDTKWSMEPLTFSLNRHQIGRMILSRCKKKVRYIKYGGVVDDMDCIILDYTCDDCSNSNYLISEYCYKIYDSIMRETGYKIDYKKLRMCISTTRTSKVGLDYVHYELPEASAGNFIKELLRGVKSSCKSVSELSIYSESLSLNYGLSGEMSEFMKSSSALSCAVIAIASLMNDDIYIDTSSENVVRIIVTFRSKYKYSENNFNLLLKLLYSEMEDDSVVSMEYRNSELALYRTLLTRYVLQLLISPTNATRTIRFGFNGSVDFKAFIIRLFKFINFRTNFVLMDRIVFEKYLTTRVVNKNKSKGITIMNGVTAGTNRYVNGDNEAFKYGYNMKGRNRNRIGTSRMPYRMGSGRSTRWVEGCSPVINGGSGRKKYTPRYGVRMGRMRHAHKFTYGSTKNHSNRAGYMNGSKSGRNGGMEENGYLEEYDDHSDLPLPKMLSVFGFLEYHGRSVKVEHNKISVKSEEIGQTEKYFEPEYFFTIVFKLLRVLRSFIIDENRFGSDVLDQFTFKYYLRLCSNDFYNTYNTTVIYSDIRQVLDTNHYGEKVENAILSQFFGEEEDEYNDFMESLGLLENSMGSISGSREKINSKKSWKLQFVDLLKLNNRYTKRMFYTLTHEFCQEFFRCVPDSCLPSLLCSWSSSLPTDSMSTVRSEKIATARYVIYILLCRICSANYGLNGGFMASIEPLVSAVNVILVNLEIVYKAPTSYGLCEVISEDEHTPLKSDACIQSPQEFHELVSGDLDVSDSNFYENIVSKYNTMKAENVKRYRERREEMRKRNREQVYLLLQISWLFGKIMDKITNNLYKTIMNEDNSFITIADGKLVVTCVGKKRALMYSMINLLTLIDNTMSTIIRICILSTLNISDSSTSENTTPKRTLYSDKFPGLIKLEVSTDSQHKLSQSYKDISSKRNTSQQYYAHKVSHKFLENVTHSDIIVNIKAHKENVKSRLASMSSLQFNRNYSREGYIGSEGEDVEYISESDGYYDDGVDVAFKDSALADDLDNFIDFETDQHLSMLTYKNNGQNHYKAKNLDANKRLKMTDLRSEWRCIIK